MRLRLLALLIAVPALVRAQTRGFNAPEMYPAASHAWAALIGDALARPVVGQPLTPALSALAAPGLERATAFAPVAVHLEASLGIAPAAFAALPASEQRAALDLAADAARAELQQKSIELDAQSRALASPERTLDKDGRAELFGVVASLQEMRARYGPLLDDADKARVEDSYGRALLRAVRVRDALIGGRADALGGALGAEGREDSAPAAAPAADPALLPAGPRARKLYAQMSESTAGWGADDVDALLTGYGFVRRDGKHRNYSHPDFPSLHDSYSHQRQLKDVYIKSALSLVRELARLRAQAAAPAAVRASAPDLTRVRLEDLAVLLPPEKPAAPKPVRAARPAPAPVAVAAAAAAARSNAAARETTARAPDRLAPATARPVAPKKEEPPAPAAPAPAAAPAATARTLAPAWVRRLLGLDR
jgi:hypothetical protein